MLTVSSDAVTDMRYLLGREYRRESVVKFVGDKYALEKPQRLLLYRCVYPPGTAKAHKDKLTAPGSLSKARLSIDGFNVLWTIDSVLKGRPIFLSDDGLVRDISMVKGKPSVDVLFEAIRLAVDSIGNLKPVHVHFVFDRPISQSGEVSKMVRETLESKSINGMASTSASVDSEIIGMGDVVASSDSVIIEKATRVFDLGGYVVTKSLQITPIKI